MATRKNKIATKAAPPAPEGQNRLKGWATRQLVQNQTRFFAAAEATSQALADVAIPLVGRAIVTSETAAFLNAVGKDLEKLNIQETAAIKNGTLGGPNLDSQLVHTEQTEVQKQLDTLHQSNPAGYAKTIADINGALNPGKALQAAGTIAPGSDKAYNQVLDGVRKDLGRDINFANQDDREKLGNALVQHIRQPGGNDVTGK